MKKIIRSAVLAIFFIVLSLIFSCGILEDDTKYAKISSGNISSDGFVYDLYENGEAHITGWKNPGLMLYIPDEIDGKPVTAIESSAFAGEEGIMYLKLGKNISEIGNLAFSGCTLLLRVDGGDSVRKIGDSAFSSCAALSEIKGLSSVSDVGSSAFFMCSALSNVSFFDRVKTIGVQSFYGCNALTSVNLSGNVTEVGENAFAYCESLHTVDLGGLAVIPDGMFEKCISLASVDIGGGVKKIGRNAFRGCSFLSDVKISTKVGDIGRSAFDETEWISAQTDEFVIVGNGILLKYNGKSENVVIPGNVRIVSDAFCGSSTLKSVTVGGSVEKIGEYAFSGCKALSNVIIKDKVARVCDNAFAGCSGLTRVYFPLSLKAIGKGAFRGCPSDIGISYQGNRNEWIRVSIGAGNDVIEAASVSFGQKP